MTIWTRNGRKSSSPILRYNNLIFLTLIFLFSAVVGQQHQSPHKFQNHRRINPRPPLARYRQRERRQHRRYEKILTSPIHRTQTGWQNDEELAKYTGRILTPHPRLIEQISSTRMTIHLLDQLWRPTRWLQSWAGLFLPWNPTSGFPSKLVLIAAFPMNQVPGKWTWRGGSLNTPNSLIMPLTWELHEILHSNPIKE